MTYESLAVVPLVDGLLSYSRAMFVARMLQLETRRGAVHSVVPSPLCQWKLVVVTYPHVHYQIRQDGDKRTKVV